ncbi:AT-rich interactive domain-containing protein 2 [Globomyces sp. JEL0801]|nr:AT-rich interactive domain-containing protein 2 [Globomyces sp. JEL0801]
MTQTFLEQVEAVHQKLGMQIQNDHVVGGVTVQLEQIYNRVQLLGGFNKVTADRGWKRVASTFNLPATCTNSAFVFKNIYKKHLLAFESLKNGLSLDDAKLSLTQILPQSESKKRPLDHNNLSLELHQPAQKQKFSLNPDDDGKEDKYLQGGWQNRLSLALKSNLPNEVDWAFNKLVKLSYQHQFYVGYIPGLPEILLDHAMPFFDKLSLNTSPLNFETSISKSLSSSDQAVVPEMASISLFNSQPSFILLERVLQSLHIIRNMSFMNENAFAFSRDHKLLTILAKSLALPSVSYCKFFSHDLALYVTFSTFEFESLTYLDLEIQQHSLDIFENIASLLVLRGPSDFYLACLKKMIFESDRSRILGALRSLIRLISNEQNVKIMMLIDTPIIQRLLQLLLVPDEDIEFFYLFTNISPEVGVRITGCVLKLLLKFLHWKGLGMDVFKATVPRLTNSIGPITPPANLDHRALDHFHAAMWLQTACEVDPSATMTHDTLLNEYTNYCTENNLNAIELVELLKLVTKMYSEGSVSFQPPITMGFKPKSKEELDLPEPLNYNCGIEKCGKKFDTYDTLITHLSKHDFKTLKCKWKHCKESFENVKILLNHIQTHVPETIDPPKPLPTVESGAIFFNDPNDELIGIPLTALLVIRNIAKHPHNHSFFAPFEKDLTTLLTHPKFSKTVGTILAELK